MDSDAICTFCLFQGLLQNRKVVINMVRTGKFSWISLLMGIILIAGSISVFRKPTATFLILSTMLGIVAIIRGVILIIKYYRDATSTGKSYLSLGILLTAVGIVLSFRPAFVANVFAFIIAIWLIADSIRNLVRVNLLKPINTGFYMFNIVLNILLLVAGVVLMFNPLIVGVSVSLIIGLSLLVLGIEYLTFAFFNSQADF